MNLTELFKRKIKFVRTATVRERLGYRSLTVAVLTSNWYGS
jgi:hypothetical protein